MNKPLKFHSSKTRLWFISDQHQQHEPSWTDTPPLWKSRGFKSIIDHDNWIRDQWHALIKPEDVVIDIGDRVFSDPKGQRFRQTTLWPGRQLILDGNHRSGHAQIHQEAIGLQFPSIAATVDANRLSVYPVTINNLTFVGESLSMWIDAQAVYCQHYAPFIWPEVSAGGFAIVGHSHARAPLLNPDATTFGKILDVSLDNAITHTGTPFFDWDTVKRIMSAKPVRKSDHH